MATTITDDTGAKWIISGSAGPLKRIRDLTEFDLGDLYETEKLKAFNAILEDRPKSLAVLKAACGDEALKLSDEDWDSRWPVDPLLQAMFALGREVARFFTPLRSKAVISAMDRLERAYQEVGAGIQNSISDVPLPSIVPSTSGESSASTPAS